jgi:ariadne-1
MDESYDEEGLFDDDMEEEDDDDQVIFEPVVRDKDIKKSYQVDFIVHSSQDIVSFQTKEVKHVAGILGCLEQHAATLLRFFKWNKERLIERYMDSPVEVCALAGVILDSSKQPKFAAVAGFECGICCDDSPGLATLALTCGHRYCKDCYSRYLTQKINEEGESRRIQCLESSCKVIVDEKTIELVVNDAVYKK